MTENTINIPRPVTAKDYVKLVSGIFLLTGVNLTGTEIEVLSAFVELTEEYKSKGVTLNAFSADGKKEVCIRMGRKGGTISLNNVLKSLCDKKAITRLPEGGYRIKSFLSPSTKLVVTFKPEV